MDKPENVDAAPVHRVVMPWLPLSDVPGDGDRLWIAVVEPDGVRTHVEFARAWLSDDGMMVERFEDTRGEELWPPKDVLVWMPCEMPAFIALCPFCGTPITTKTFDSCCTSMIACRAMIRAETESAERQRSTGRDG